MHENIREPDWSDFISSSRQTRPLSAHVLQAKQRKEAYLHDRPLNDELLNSVCQILLTYVTRKMVGQRHQSGLYRCCRQICRKKLQTDCHGIDTGRRKTGCV